MTTKILIAIAVSVAGGAIVTGTAVAVDRNTSPGVAPMTMGDMMAASPSSTTKLTIKHVQKGCHVWSHSSRQAASMRLNLRRGARLVVLDQDVDAHKLIQLAGPKLALDGPMMMGHSQTITFVKTGLYWFKTKVVEMGHMVEVETLGPDNTLRLTISVR
jgi:hypothetical protein